jgi:hypothetical protein
MMLPLQVVAEMAIQIQEDHAYGAEADAGFDGGEFSGPAHMEMETEAIGSLASRNGFTYDQVMDEVSRLEGEDMFNADWEP